MPLFSSTLVAVFTLVLSFIFGTVLASFITCTAGRLLAGMDWVNEHSHCDTCGHQLGALDLFPIFSYVLLGGKCRYCGAKVPIRCLISEVLLGFVFVGVVLCHGNIDVVMGRNLLLAMLMMGISFCEIDGKVIHSGFITAMLTIWIGALPFVPDLQNYIADGVIACFLICGFFLVISYLRTSKGKGGFKPGFIKLMAVYLLYTGLYAGVAFLAVSFILHMFVKPFKKTIVPAMSVCCLIFLCCMTDRMDPTLIHGYIAAVADYIKVF